MTQGIHTTAVGQSAGVAAGRDIAASMRTEISAAAVAALVVACLVLSSSHMPLPALPWAAAFLFLAIQQDVRGMRIPNWLTLPSLVVAIGLDHAAYIEEQYGHAALLFNQIACGERRPILDTWEAVPDYADSASARRVHICNVVDHIFGAAPDFLAGLARFS